MSSTAGQSDFIPLLQFDRPVDASALKVVVKPDYNRLPAPTNALEESIDKTWQARIAANPRLFNGTKFRLHSVVEGSEGAELQLGVTDYRENLGTNNAIEGFRKEIGTTDVTPQRDVELTTPFMSQTLGVEGLVVTSDQQLVFFRRSQHVAEMPGWLCCPGGHAEPKPCLEKLGVKQPGDLTHVEAAAKLGENSAVVVEELFGSIVDEVVEETGVPRELIRNLGLVGIIANKAMLKPDAIFVVKVDMKADDVVARHRDGHAREEFEAEGGLVCVPIPRLPTPGSETVEDPAATAVAGVQAALGELPITPPSMACIALGIKAVMA